MAQFTKQVRSTVLPEVLELIQNIDLNVISDDTPYKTEIKEWLKPVIDLSDFWVYPINGITEGLNYWMGTESRKIYKDIGDYEWVDGDFANGDIKYVSVPSSIDGNFRQIPKDVPVALDLAYVGTTAIQKIDIDKNVEKVFFSLSKPFGLKNVRTGWYFTRKVDVKLQRLHIKANYYNYYAHAIAESVIKNFSIDYIHNKFCKMQQDICNNHAITPSDSVWLASSTDHKYKDYRRNNGRLYVKHADTARLCITEFMDEQKDI